eukprot:299737-Prorocentrum_minimum.AAC.1
MLLTLTQLARNPQLEIIDGVITAVAAATKALELNEAEVKYCVDTLESVQSTLVVLQGIPVAVEPLVDKLITLNECHAELVASTIQVPLWAYALQPRAIGSRSGHMLSTLAQLAPAPGICSSP